MTSDDRPPLDEFTPLDQPLLVCALAGWIDAGGAAIAAVNALVTQCSATVAMAFDGDEYLDFRARRPTLTLVEGVHASMAWPELELLVGTTRDGRDIVILRGPEPDVQWRRFARSVTDVAQRLGVVRMVGLGAFPFTAPHTRAPRISVTAPTHAAIRALPYLRSSLEVPAGAAAVLADAMSAAGIPSLTLWAQIPHYAAAMPYPDGAAALLRALCDTTGIELDLTELQQEAQAQRTRIDTLIAENPEHAAMVHQMELAYDASTDSQPTSFEIPTADQLAAEVERFLRDQ